MYQLPNTEQFVLEMNTSRRYQIMISTPKEEAPEEGFPVLFVLDGNAVFASITEAIRLQTRKPHGYRPAIVVAVGYETDEPFHRENRFWDYTVAATADELMETPHMEGWPKSGGIEPFLDFIENELIPFVKKKYEVNTSKFALFGHSLGGLATLHTLFTRPRLFQYYIAGSPSIWWKNGYIKGKAKEFLERSKENAGSSAEVVKVLISVGGNEKEMMIQEAKAMYQHLVEVEQEWLKLELLVMPNTGHVTVLHPLMTEMLKFFLSDENESIHL
ncbi:alpha/beta hydrolase [Alkalihalobacillus sp. 1P02AB]|uniref:alpha/beta hydrolase n=1 Tax=Alkalihalobacillus sp. 1P02AB TaxID=3132260 RepID=UPI0039A6759C